jgi:hypothetical protein
LASEAVDVDFRRSIRIGLECDGADLRARRGAINSIDIDLAVPGTGDGISGWEVDFETAAVGTGRHGEGYVIVAFVGGTVILGDGVIDWKSD